MTIIRRESAADIESIRTVNRQAFGSDEEGRLVDLLRDGGFARVSMVATLDEQIVGHILVSDLPIVTAEGTIHGLSLAPLAVVPNRQRCGSIPIAVRHVLINSNARNGRHLPHVARSRRVEPNVSAAPIRA
jgi:predicted N-acetyltransferase YhbS